jgi:hypothetical protein
LWAIIGGANEVSWRRHELRITSRIVVSDHDDFLDVTATAEDLGKTPGKDARSNKATYPALHGMEETRAARSSPSRRLRRLDQLDRPTESCTHRRFHPASTG